ncbi:MAG: Ni/Fe hydrogenase subunit alpha [Patescibacteria group bacterium]
MKIKINHLAKMEGHASFVGEIIKTGEVKNAMVDTEEGARLIEGILIGRHYSEAKTVTSRICGVCPVVHYLTALQAMEGALNIKPRSIDIEIRKLMESTQIIYSHALHMFFLSLPDFLNYDDDVKMAGDYPKETQIAIEIRNWSIDIQKMVGGRTVHPLAPTEGGMNRYPEKKILQELLSKADEVIDKCVLLANFFAKLKYPEFARETEYIALGKKGEYAYYDGNITSSKGLNITPEKFGHDIEEIDRAYKLVKRTHWKDAPYFVGALSRLNLHGEFLHAKAAKVIKDNIIKFPSINSFHNVYAQAIENVHFAEEAKEKLEFIIKNYSQCDTAKNIKFSIKAGKGVGAIEAPRGTLYHYYEIDSKGYIKDCNIMSPTAQFLANLESDLTFYLPKTLKMKTSERELRIKQLIRAYDPCISCATH